MQKTEVKLVTFFLVLLIIVYFLLRISSVSSTLSAWTSLLSPVALIFYDTIGTFFPTVIRIGNPIKSLSLNLTSTFITIVCQDFVTSSHQACFENAFVRLALLRPWHWQKIKCTSNGANSLRIGYIRAVFTFWRFGRLMAQEASVLLITAEKETQIP